ncbi:MAG: hypothetical protein AAGJ08_09305 [Cyanobacteria bacterium P01_H01_bin.35]
MPQTIQISVSCPHDLYEVVQLLSDETGRSQSAIACMLMEKGYPIVFEELNKIEIYKDLREKRKAKEKDTVGLTDTNEDDEKSKPKEVKGSKNNTKTSKDKP